MSIKKHHPLLKVSQLAPPIQSKQIRKHSLDSKESNQNKQQATQQPNKTKHSSFFIRTTNSRFKDTTIVSGYRMKSLLSHERYGSIHRHRKKSSEYKSLKIDLSKEKQGSQNFVTKNNKSNTNKLTIHSNRTSSSARKYSYFIKQNLYEGQNNLVLMQKQLRQPCHISPAIFNQRNSIPSSYFERQQNHQFRINIKKRMRVPNNKLNLYETIEPWESETLQNYEKNQNWGL